MPLITSRTMRPTLMAASLTPAAGSFNRLVVVPYNPAFVRHGDPMYGTQRLAVMAVDSTRVRHRQLPSLASQSSRVADLRPRPTIVSDAAESVRARIRAEIVAACITASAKKRSHPKKIRTLSPRLPSRSRSCSLLATSARQSHHPGCRGGGWLLRRAVLRHLRLRGRLVDGHQGARG